MQCFRNKVLGAKLKMREEKVHITESVLNVSSKGLNNRPVGQCNNGKKRKKEAEFNGEADVYAFSICDHFRVCESGTRGLGVGY